LFVEREIRERKSPTENVEIHRVPIYLSFSLFSLRVSNTTRILSIGWRWEFKNIINRMEVGEE